MTQLFIIRHGNTFDTGDVIRRVGLKTNLPLSNSGQAQAKALGRWWMNVADKQPLAQVFTSELQRTQQTAALMFAAQNQSIQTQTRAFLNEIDYGVDDGQPETAVIERLGEAALTAWEQQQIVPPGWRIDIGAIEQHWQQFAQHVKQQYPNQSVIVITSNGIARFARCLLPTDDATTQPSHWKMRTGAVSCLIATGMHWQCQFWNHRPND